MDLKNTTTDVIVIAYAGLLVVQMYFQGLRPSYRAKRRLLLGKAAREPSFPAPERNVYEAEEDLFDALSRRKKPEFRLDFWFDYILCGIGTAIMLLLAVSHDFKALGYTLGLGAAFSLWLIQAFYFEKKWMRMDWR